VFGRGNTASVGQRSACKCRPPLKANPNHTPTSQPPTNTKPNPHQVLKDAAADDDDDDDVDDEGDEGGAAPSAAGADGAPPLRTLSRDEHESAISQSYAQLAELEASGLDAKEANASAGWWWGGWGCGLGSVWWGGGRGLVCEGEWGREGRGSFGSQHQHPKTNSKSQPHIPTPTPTLTPNPHPHPDPHQASMWRWT